MSRFTKRFFSCVWLFVLTLCLLGVSCPAQELSPVITVDHAPNATRQLSKPCVILVSLDGFRYDYAKRYAAKNLLALASRGVSAPQGMIPSYPSLTFPNHYIPEKRSAQGKPTLPLWPQFPRIYNGCLRGVRCTIL